eukprot:1458662-Pyramimonas_sp.AAC.1
MPAPFLETSKGLVTPDSVPRQSTCTARVASECVYSRPRGPFGRPGPPVHMQQHTPHEFCDEPNA